MKNDYSGQFEVAQLQKFFFSNFACLSCFQSGIMVKSHMLLKNVILDHF